MVARGDMQITHDETYAAMLAAQIFRAMIAIMTYFDLESRQYNCQLAYLNAYLSKPIYGKMPLGTPNSSLVFIQKALYRLKESGHLWSKLL